jgi:hypothetical protein
VINIVTSSSSVDNTNARLYRDDADGHENDDEEEQDDEDGSDCADGVCEKFDGCGDTRR